MKKRHYIFFLLAIILGVTEYWLQTRLTWDRENSRLGHSEAYRYYHPAPPVGKWAAIYTADFAKKIWPAYRWYFGRIG